MATIRKGSYTRPIPEGAKLITKDGKQFARFKHKGRLVTAPLTKDGKKARVETTEWYIRYKDPADGKWKERRGYTDRRATETLAAELQQRLDRRASGHADPFEEQHLRPLVEHLAEFDASLEAKGITTSHRVEVIGRVRRIIDACGFQRIGDLQASTVQVFLGELRGSGRSLQTINHHIGSIKHFSRWLISDRRTNHNQLAHIPKLNTRTDRRHDRRALSEDEFARLIDSAENGPVIENVDGSDRAMVYILSCWTGYRRKELASLTLRSFDLDAQTPVVRVTAAYSKNRRADEVPLHSIVVGRLRAWMATKGEIPPGTPISPLRTATGSKVMRLDLETAGIPYQDEDGLFADFHSHRHGFITNLGKAGVPLATAQKLARHHDPKLTSNVYTHLELSDKATAVESLPSPPGGEGNRELGVLQATGTDDACLVTTERPPQPSQKLRTMGHIGAQHGTNSTDRGTLSYRRNPLR